MDLYMRSTSSNFIWRDGTASTHQYLDHYSKKVHFQPITNARSKCKTS